MGPIELGVHEQSDSMHHQNLHDGRVIYEASMVYEALHTAAMPAWNALIEHACRF